MNLSEFIANSTTDDNYLPYTISPFQKEYVIQYEKILRKSSGRGVPETLKNRYPGMFFSLELSGRSALEIALNDLNLKKTDNIWIETTTNNFYISSCVTKTIDNFCNWSREYSENTRAILINHEFGFPVEKIERYKKFNLPIIEDCAFSFLSNNEDGTVGKYADYILISIPKFLPIPFGGGLYSRRKIDGCSFLDKDRSLVLNSLTEYYLRYSEENKEIRRKNHTLFSAILGAEGLLPRFIMEECHVPGVFMFSINSDVDLVKMKIKLNAIGIQSSVFYGESAYFVPCNQVMDEFDVDYISRKVIGVIGTCLI